jgi:hypothetical protein
MKRAFFTMLLLGVVVVVLIGWLRSVQQADTTYVPRVSARTWPDGGPLVAIDDAHWNAHTAARGFAPFAKLLGADGYVIAGRGNVASPAVFGSAKVVVIGNALGFRGAIQQLGQMVSIGLDALAADALTDAEADQLETWVQEGGSLLLVAEQAPASRAVRSLAERFAVTMHDATVFDPDHSERDDPSTIVFTREGRTLAVHPITGTSGRADAISRVVTFGGQALDGPPHATKLLIFSGTAYELGSATAGPEDRRPVPGLAQALAIYHGRGKVVVLGDADVITSRLRSSAGLNDRVGLHWPNSDNELFARRIMAWLSGAVQ